jgi:O-antigen ligase
MGTDVKARFPAFDRPFVAGAGLGLDLVLVAVTLAAAAAVGVLSAHDPLLALAAVVALIGVPTAVLRPTLVPPILVLSIFAEAVTIGGVTVGRLIAPLALIAVVSQLLQAPGSLAGVRAALALIGAYVFLAVASLIWTVSVSGTFDTLASLLVSLAYMAAFAVLVRAPSHLRRLLWAFALSSTGLALLWMAQYAIGVDRRFNAAGDPNFFAALQVVALPLVVVLLSRERDPLRRLALYLAMALIAASVLSTLSRGGFITLAIVVVLIVLLPARMLFPTRKEKAAFLLTAVVGLALLFPLAWGDLRHRFEVGFSQPNVAGGRGDLWLAATHGYRQHPFTGLGYGAFKQVSFQLLRTTPGVNLQEHLRFAVRAGEYVHNAYLGSLVELGPLGLSLFVGVLGTTARLLRRTAREARLVGDPFVGSFANALFLSLLSFSVSSLLLSTETSRVLWLIVGLSLALARWFPARLSSTRAVRARRRGRSLEPVARPADIR